MFIYNVTTKLNWNIHDAWLEWMQAEHIPDMLSTHCFVRSQLLKLHEQDEEDGPTYIVQYFAESKALYNRYMELYAGAIRKDYNNKWGDNFIAFRTLLEVIE
ncbi:DUF4286 family protein [Parafilimonas sp.]|uniref:DUF4286 family protein n=1 Tax=Parafilimonas sp. TaxID=1969739 RepID=UPI0039E2862E